MAMKKTTDQIVTAYRLINTAKLAKMEDAEKFQLLKAVRQLKKVNAEFEDFLKDVQEKLKPEGFDAIVQKIQSKQELSAEETAKVDKYNKDVQSCLKDELDKEVELGYEPLSEGALTHLVASNDFNVSEILVIEDVIGG